MAAEDFGNKLKKAKATQALKKKDPDFFSKESFTEPEGEGFQSTVIPALALALFGPTTGSVVAGAARGVAEKKLAAELKGKVAAKTPQSRFQLIQKEIFDPETKKNILALKSFDKQTQEIRDLGEFEQKQKLFKGKDIAGREGVVGSKTGFKATTEQTDVLTSPSGIQATNIGPEDKKILIKKQEKFNIDTKALRDSLDEASKTFDIIKLVKSPGDIEDNKAALTSAIKALVRASGDTRISDPDFIQLRGRLKAKSIIFDKSTELGKGKVSIKLLNDFKALAKQYQKSAGRHLNRRVIKFSNELTTAVPRFSKEFARDIFKTGDSEIAQEKPSGKSPSAESIARKKRLLEIDKELKTLKGE